MVKNKENVPDLKPWGGCYHKLTRKLYFQRGGKWVTTDYSICEECGSLTKKALAPESDEDRAMYDADEREGEQ